MTTKRCHCNGSRGTDCDWCQGSGWITNPIKLYTGSSNRTSKRKGRNPIVKKQERQPTKPIVKKQKRQPIKPKKTFDKRINELLFDLNNIGSDILEESVEYLKNKIYTLIEDLKRIEKIVSKKQRRHYNKLKSQSEQIIRLFEERVGNNKKSSFM